MLHPETEYAQTAVSAQAAQRTTRHDTEHMAQIWANGPRTLHTLLDIMAKWQKHPHKQAKPAHHAGRCDSRQSRRSPSLERVPRARTEPLWPARDNECNLRAHVRR